jgi:hypothetical protein
VLYRLVIGLDLNVTSNVLFRVGIAVRAVSAEQFRRYRMVVDDALIDSLRFISIFRRYGH